MSYKCTLKPKNSQAWYKDKQSQLPHQKELVESIVLSTNIEMPLTTKKKIELLVTLLSAVEKERIVESPSNLKDKELIHFSSVEKVIRTTIENDENVELKSILLNIKMPNKALTIVED